MTLVEGEELQRLWTLVSELSSQLASNRHLCQSLQAQADELKGQALHTGTGYTLRRFNLDISKEKFESELERINSQVVMENQALTHENKQINILLREYENTLETVMSKFRSFSHATQQHTLSLTSHYETLLSNNIHQVESASLHASTSFSNTLAHLGGLVRLALREVEGEALDSDEEDDNVKNSDPFEAEGYRVGSPSGIGPSSHTTAVNSKSTLGTKRPKTGYGSAPSRDPRWYGTGGYTGFQGDPEAEKAERALQSRTEEERLKVENETLRELLRISSDITPEIARDFGIDIPEPAGPSNWPKLGANAGKLSLGKARGSRKSLIEATLPTKAGETEAAEEALQTHWTTTPEASRSLNNAPIKYDELNDMGKESLSSPVAASPMPFKTSISHADAIISSNESKPLYAGIVKPEHVIQGSGGPPQLTSNAGKENTLTSNGIIISSPIIPNNQTEEIINQTMSPLADTSEALPLPLGEKGDSQDYKGLNLQSSNTTEVEGDQAKQNETAEKTTAIATTTLEADDKAIVRDQSLDEVQTTLTEQQQDKGEITLT